MAYWVVYQNKKGVFSREFYEISKTIFFHRTPLAAASANLTKGGNSWILLGLSF